MREATVRLLCPECRKDWESAPTDLPSHKRTFHCPNCHASRRMAEFTRTERELDRLKALQ
ncbi:MAG: hypothetical protein ABEJ31_13825 [Haloarculaceae archaeon]